MSSVKKAAAGAGRSPSRRRAARAGRTSESLKAASPRMSRGAAADAVRGIIGGDAQTLHDFLLIAPELTTAEREQIVDQALLMLEHVYVHLPLKRAMHAVDPIQRLRLLRLRLPSMSERAFHDEMITVYTHLRDLHTNYVLPNPFQSNAAVLPFRIEEFFEGDERRYVVTRVSPLVTDRNFKPGVVPVRWNGIPIARAVEINAEREAGSNHAARLAQGLESLTNRWMGMSLPPDEEWVVVEYNDGTRDREVRFAWQVIAPGSPASGVDVMSADAPAATQLGVNAKAEVQRRVRKILFSPESIAAERRLANLGADAQAVADAPAAAGVDLSTASTLPDVFDRFGAVETEHGTFGYIRIRTFNASPAPFVREFVRLLSRVPQGGLILDVRGNGGGIIAAGETLLQTLTPRHIEPALFSFISSPITQRICATVAELTPWEESIRQSVETAAAFSQGLALTPVERCNDIGQKYQGPVVLVTDASCYSTTDMFAAGFQDHGVGKILGVAASTGAGGANVWTHETLVNILAEQDARFQLPPKGASFRVAVRRSTRVGKRAGMLLEDLGVAPDEIHLMTKDDVLNGNADLIARAAGILAGMPSFTLAAAFDAGAGAAGPSLSATTKNVERLDVYVNGRPRLTLDVADGENRFAFPLGAGAAQLELRGYKGGEHVVSTRLPVLVAAQPPAAAAA